MPWDELRRHPELQALCDAGGGRACGYVDGNLIAEVHDLRAPEHAALGVDTRVITLPACDDDLTQDLAELECDAVLNQGSAPWTDQFKQKLEAMLLLATAPPLCRLAGEERGTFRTAHPRNGVPERSERTRFTVPDILAGGQLPANSGVVSSSPHALPEGAPSARCTVRRLRRLRSR